MIRALSFLTTYPEHRRFYKGAENFSGDDIMKSERSPVEVKRNVVASLRVAPVGDGHHGRDFYKLPVIEYFYRFDKLGDAILLFVHVLSNIYDNEPVFRSFTRRVMLEHFERNVDPALWNIFFSNYWKGFLESKGAALSADQKTAWDNLGSMFSQESQAYLAKMGRPHA
ncbi:unnamed protein product [Strongylus vulgaris]|uniref:Globin domain-containing protein n=1 Tax=Strongylus vulgaris TaxID=40348 RepID=A0A3P7JL48_STRVU|nr:unnamed protein product [Strongylus vulgaris]